MKNSIKLIIAELIHKPNWKFKNQSLIISNLERNGFHIIDDFLTKDEILALKQSSEKIIDSKREYVSIESNGSDIRLYGIDKLDTNFSKKLLNVNVVRTTLNKFYFMIRELQTFVLYGKIKSDKNNLGSGGGWHRDSPFTHQFKVIVYLSDVGSNNGPFMYLQNSHKYKFLKKVSHLLSKSLSEDRFTEEEINLIENKIPELKRVEFPGKEGTAIMVNTRGLHSGKIIEENSREAITLYTYNRGLPKSITSLPLFGKP